MARSKQSIGSKLFLAVGATILISFLLGISALYNLFRMNTTLDRVIDRDAQKLELLGAIQSNIRELVSLQRAMTLRALLKDHVAIDKYHDQQRVEEARLTRNLNVFAPLVSTPEGFAFMKVFADTPARYAVLDEKLYAYSMADQTDEVINLYKTDILTFSAPLPAEVDKDLDVVSRVMKQSRADAEAELTRAVSITVLLLVLCVIVGGVVIFVVRVINRDLQNAASELNSGAEQIAAASAQVASSSQLLAQGASTQAATIQETSASSAEINAMAHRTAQNSKVTASIVAETEARFLETSQSISEMVTAMEGISDSSEEISQIIKVIDQIAFQTNILALNAAVEAARAGEAGMGFAVVAEEVRNLAQRSAQAAQDTARLIQGSVTRSEAGRIKVNEVADVIRNIKTDSAKMKLLIDEINAGSQEQTQRIDVIAHSISQLEVVTQANAAGAEESAAAAQELTAQSHSVKEVVHLLDILVGGENGTRRRAA